MNGKPELAHGSSWLVAAANKVMTNSKFGIELDPGDDPSILPSLKVKGVHRDLRGHHGTSGRRPLPWIEVRGLLDGQIELSTALDPMKPQRAQISADRLTKEFIDGKVADLVDALNP